jgi:5-methylcytosine-specific restriction endonuclease McrA
MGDRFLADVPNEFCCQQPRQNNFPERIHDRKAPAGKFRLLGVDTFYGPGADFLVGDFSYRTEAITEATRRASDMKPFYVYDDAGHLLYPVPMKKRPAKSEQVKVWRDAKWLCYWCGRPLIFPPAMKILALFTGAAGYWHPNWTRTNAPLLDEQGAVIDHKICFIAYPELDNAENFVASCNKCNTRKGAALLDEWERRARHSPVKGKYGEPEHYDGLTSLFMALHDCGLVTLTAEDKAWATALRKPEAL